jgi:hypothetical protein
MKMNLEYGFNNESMPKFREYEIKLINNIKYVVPKTLEKQISNFLYKTSLDYNSDICSLGKYGVSQFKTNSNWESYNWLENYKNSIFNVNVNCTVISSLLFTEV